MSKASFALSFILSLHFISSLVYGVDTFGIETVSENIFCTVLRFYTSAEEALLAD
jgi:hypothetical protein